MSVRLALADALRIPPTSEEAAGLRALKGRYAGDELCRRAIDYLTGKSRAADTMRAPSVRPPVWLVPYGAPALDRAHGAEQAWYGLVAGWLLEHRGVVVEVRDPDDGEAPHCDMGGLVDARALMLAAQYADGVIASEGI